MKTEKVTREYKYIVYTYSKDLTLLDITSFEEEENAIRFVENWKEYYPDQILIIHKGIILR